jgi:hypothetical protein
MVFTYDTIKQNIETYKQARETVSYTHLRAHETLS